MDSPRSSRTQARIEKIGPRKVLMTTDTIGGVWQYTLSMARALARQDVQVMIASMGHRPSPAQRKAAESIPGAILRESNYKLEWMDNPWDDVKKAGDWLLELEAQFSPDVIHLNSYSHAALDWQAPVLVVAHSCVYSWFDSVRHGAPDQQWNRYREEVARGLHAADWVVAPTSVMAQSIAKHYKYQGPHSVIANGAIPPAIGKINKEQFIFSAGRLWDEAKNIRTLAEAAGILQWPVHVAGNRQHPDGGEVDFPNVQCLGTLDPSAMAYWYGRAQIYALPARYEPFGLSVLEAALAGCVLVLGDIPSLREVWGDSAVYVNPDDALALAHTLNRVMRDARLCKEYVRKSLRRAQQYTPERMLREYLVVYRDLMGRGRNNDSSLPESIAAQLG